jgi:hypothetical protein
MSAVTIEVVRDTASTVQGAAVIRLVGLFEMPRIATFRIEPIDDDGTAPPPKGWPSGDLVPQSVRIGEKGVELLVGASVVDAPSLLPGTPVAISVPALAVRKELRWPNLPVQRIERRAAVVVTGEQRAADMAARAEAQRAELARITAERQESERREREAREQEQKAREAAVAAELVRKLAEAEAAAARPAAAVAAPRGPAPAGTDTPPMHAGPVSEPADGAAPSRRMVPPPLPSKPPQVHGEADAAQPQPAARVMAAVSAPAVPRETTPQPSAAQPQAGSPAATRPDPAATGGTADHERVSAGDILARQVSTREAPSRGGMAGMVQAFALGCVLAGGVGYASSSFLAGDETASRRRSEEMARQLMIEADDLRRRLAVETAAKQTIEGDSARRIAALEAERQKLIAAASEARQESELTARRDGASAQEIAEQKRLAAVAAAEVGALKSQLAAAEQALKQAQSSQGGALAEVQAEAGRQRLAATEAQRRAEAATAQIEDLEKQLATATEQARNAEREKAAAQGERETEAKRRGDADSARARAQAEVESLRGRLAEAEAARATAAAAGEAAAAVGAMRAVAHAGGGTTTPAPSGKAVSLRVKGSEFEVSGELKSFDGQRYVIEAAGVGAITLDAGRVTCSGAGCPPPPR